MDSQYFCKEFLTNDIVENYRYISDICLIRSGTTPTERDEDLQYGVALLKTNNIRNGILNASQCRELFYIDEATNVRMKQTELHKDDILINIVGATTDVVGRCSLLSKDFPKANITQAMALLRIFNKHINKFNKHYIFTLLLSSNGHRQIRRIARPTGQYNMNLQEVAQIKIPILEFNFQQKIKEIVELAENIQCQSTDAYATASTLLLNALGMENFAPKENSVTMKLLSESFDKSGRLDAEYFQIKYEEYEKSIKTYHGGYVYVYEKFAQVEDKCNRSKENYPYIEIGDISVGNGSYIYNVIESIDLPANAKIMVCYGDLLISKVRPNRGAVAIINDYIDDLVVSGAFTVLRPKSDYKLEVLSVLLRMPIYRDWFLKFNVGSSYPTIKDEDILNMPIPLIDLDKQIIIAEQVKQSFALRRQSERLLEQAKRAVEIAVEQGEEKAIAWLNDNGGEG